MCGATVRSRSPSGVRGLELVKRYGDAAKRRRAVIAAIAIVAEQVDLLAGRVHDQCFRLEIVELLQSGREAGHRRGRVTLFGRPLVKLECPPVVASRPRKDEIRTSCLRVLDASNAPSSEVHENRRTQDRLLFALDDAFGVLERDQDGLVEILAQQRTPKPEQKRLAVGARRKTLDVKALVVGGEPLVHCLVQLDLRLEFRVERGKSRQEPVECLAEVRACRSSCASCRRCLRRAISFSAVEGATVHIPDVALDLTALLPIVWAPPDWRTLAFGTLIGCAATAGHWLIVIAFRFGDASGLAPFTYTQLVWSTTLGAILFGAVPDVRTLLGGKRDRSERTLHCSSRTGPCSRETTRETPRELNDQAVGYHAHIPRMRVLRSTGAVIPGCVERF